VNGVTLDDAPLGERALVACADVEGALGRQLADLGLRSGEPLTPLHRTPGGGPVLAVGDTRLALARSVLRRIDVTGA
jgi:Fe2+ transport system protein FeoA